MLNWGNINDSTTVVEGSVLLVQRLIQQETKHRRTFPKIVVRERHKRLMKIPSAYNKLVHAV